MLTKFFGSGAIAGACLMIASTQAQAGALPERVVQAVNASIADGRYQTVVFGLINGDQSAVQTFGKLDNGKAPDGDTVYEIGSITKTFTATMLAQEVLSKHVTLETPVSKLLPDFTIPSRAGKPITLGDIGTQRSGLPRMPANFSPKDSANPYADYDAAMLRAFLAGYNLPRDPGASYEYSNLAFGLLGYALAQTSHTTYGNLVARQVLRPLGMAMSGTSFTDVMRAHLAPGHDENGKPASNWDLDALAGAGAVRSTANDMLRYLKANMGMGHSPLQTAMKFAQQPRRRHRQRDAHRAGVDDDRQGSRLAQWGHGGLPQLHRFHCGRTPRCRSPDQHGRGGRRPGVRRPRSERAPYCRSHKAITLPAASLDAYVGTYKLSDNFFVKFFRVGDTLMTQATGQGAFQVFPSAPDEFFAKIAPITITFQRNAKGEVSGLVLHQNGDDAAPKLNAAEIPPEPKQIALDPATLHDYVGKYQFPFGAVLDVTLSGEQLAAQLSGQPSVPIYPSAKDEFFYKIVDARLSYERDAAGKVVAVVLHQNGQDMRAPRVSER